MTTRLFTSVMTVWFILVNLPQAIPILNRVSPQMMGIPFNFVWIWGLNLAITIFLAICAKKLWITHHVDVELAKQFSQDQGIERAPE